MSISFICCLEQNWAVLAVLFSRQILNLKNVNNKKNAPKLIFFNEKKIEKDSDNFWHKIFDIKFLSLPLAFLIVGSLGFPLWYIYLWWIFWVKFLGEFFWNFWGEFLIYNVLTIASFRIGVPSILFFMKKCYFYSIKLPFDAEVDEKFFNVI